MTARASEKARNRRRKPQKPAIPPGFDVTSQVHRNLHFGASDERTYVVGCHVLQLARGSRRFISPRHLETDIPFSFIALVRVFRIDAACVFRAHRRRASRESRFASASLRRLHTYLSYYRARLYPRTLIASTTGLVPIILSWGKGTCQKRRSGRLFRHTSRLSLLSVRFSPYRTEYLATVLESENFSVNRVRLSRFSSRVPSLVARSDE